MPLNWTPELDRAVLLTMLKQAGWPSVNWTTLLSDLGPDFTEWGVR